MGKCTFKGGVHPFDGKDLSKDNGGRNHNLEGHWLRL